MPEITSTLTLGLCEGQRSLPDDVQGYVFEAWVYPVLPLMGSIRLEQLAYVNLRLESLVFIAMNRTSPAFSDEDDARHIPIKSLRVYVTGWYTPALIALLNVCRNEGIAVTLLHYDTNTNNYWEQEVSI